MFSQVIVKFVFHGGIAVPCMYACMAVKPFSTKTGTVMKNREKEISAFVRLLDIMDELRVKCPWDREQTIESIRPLTVEETFELSDAIMNGDMENVKKELGDILLHIVFYSKIASEKGDFNIADVMDALANKLVYRHPHVFAQEEVRNAGEVVKNWEQLKRTEKGGNRTVLSGVPVSLPSLIKAYRMQDKARAVGFDWDDRHQVWDKVEEEIEEFRAELEKIDDDSGNVSSEAVSRAEGELGDLIFSIVNAARLWNLNPDTALEMTNGKFRRRFTEMEKRVKEAGRNFTDMSLEEMEEVWQSVKKDERGE